MNNWVSQAEIKAENDAMFNMWFHENQESLTREYVRDLPTKETQFELWEQLMDSPEDDSDFMAWVETEYESRDEDE